MPPVGYLGNGPAGFASYPGTGLTDDYRGHFFMCDYGYTPGRSGVWTFRVEPDGAGFRMVDDEHFAWSMLATDFDFAWDGRMFVSLFSQLSQAQSIVTLRHEASASDPRVAEVEALAREGMGAREVPELVALLRHDDRRIRLRAQFELARREEAAALGTVARDPEAPTLARLHGLWGLGQLGAAGLQASGIEDLAWLEGAPEEVRAQAAKVAGEADGVWLTDDLVAMVASETPRVRFFAAQSLGRLRYAPAIPLLAELLRENDDRDVFLRHAALFALYRIGDLDAVLPLADDPDASVRLGALIVLRRAADPRVARFLDDEDPFLVVEAARAIHDVPIPEAMPTLAGLAGAVPPPNADDPQSGHALLRRVIQANVILGGEGGALKLAALAASSEQPERMRRMALEALGSYAAPPPRDVALGAWRPLDKRDPSVVYAAWDAYGTALAKGDLGDRALELATEAGRTPLSDDELLAEVQNDALGEPRRVAALRALAGRAEVPAGILDEAVAAALASDAPALRAEARDVLAVVRPAEALAALAAVQDDAMLAERQRVFATLTVIEGAEAEARLAAAMDALEAGDLDPGVQLDAMAAIRAREGALAERLAAWQAATANGDLVASRRWALAGGDPVAGEAIFQGNGDCLRCHGAEAGHGGGVGPPLAGIAGREDAGYLLESVLDPGARIVPGFATVSVTTSEGVTHTGTLLEDRNGELLLATGDGEVRVDAGSIASQSPPASAMPPMGLTLAPHELRDLIAYLATL
jgi:putative heme-binding domain-containing protein